MGSNVGLRQKQLMTPDMMGGGGGPSSLAIGAALSGLIANSLRSNIDQEKIKRYRSMSLRQLEEMPDSIEKQMAIQEKDELGRSGEVGGDKRFVESKPASEIKRQILKKISPLGTLEGQNIHFVKNPDIGNEEDHFFKNNVEAWTRSQDINGTPVAFEVQGSHDATPGKDRERMALEAFLSEILGQGGESVGLTDVQTALKSQGHGYERDHMSYRYGKKLPNLMAQYLKTEPIERYYSEPLSSNEVEENIQKISKLGPAYAWLDLYNSLKKDLATAGEYTPIEKRLFSEDEGFSPYGDPFDGASFEMKKDIAKEKKVPTGVFTKIPGYLGFDIDPLRYQHSDRNYGLSESEGFDVSRKDREEAIDYNRFDPLKKDKIKENYKAWWDLWKKQEVRDNIKRNYRIDIEPSILPKDPPKEPIEVKYGEYDMSKLREAAERGELPWIYISSIAKKLK